MERVEDFLVVEIAGHLKGFRVLFGRMVLDTRNGFHCLLHGGNTLAAAKMHAFQLERLHLLSLRAGFLGHFDAVVAALSEIAGRDQRVGRFLNRRFIRAGEPYGSGVLVHVGGRAFDIGDGFFDALNAALAAKMDTADFGGNLGCGRKRDN